MTSPVRMEIQDEKKKGEAIFNIIPRSVMLKPSIIYGLKPIYAKL